MSELIKANYAAIGLASHGLALYSTFQESHTDPEETPTQQKIDATDCEIDQLVYELYGLTDKEIRIVEEATEAKR